MKTKKNVEKMRRKPKKSLLEVKKLSASAFKQKKVRKTQKIASNGVVGEALKQNIKEHETGIKQACPQRQLLWHEYLKTFCEVEDLTCQQKEIMVFCSGKGMTPPRRKQKFLNFVRSCYTKQAEYTDENLEELFDILLSKYNDFKEGNYKSLQNESKATTASSSKSNNKNSFVRTTSGSNDGFELVKTKKKKYQKELPIDCGDE